MKTLILAREGFLPVCILAALAIGSVAIGAEFLAFVLTLGLIYCLWFFRNPERIPDERDSLAFIAPIDGEVVSIESASDSVTVSIKTGFFDARLIRSPVQSVVVSSSVSHGVAGATNYLRHAENFSFNDKVSLTLIPNRRPSRLYHSNNGSYLGERLGFFYGGTAEIALPTDSEVKVAIGAKIRAGESAIGFARAA
ncbi:MAG: hypothetical protein LBF86_02675 [Helicobacteraceae bacterium]|jgi:phosphatidylserine decarboxylase|nr:hypothetical protein [Helicobacteraceae bacterium]